MRRERGNSMRPESSRFATPLSPAHAPTRSYHDPRASRASYPHRILLTSRRLQPDTFCRKASLEMRSGVPLFVALAIAASASAAVPPPLAFELLPYNPVVRAIFIPVQASVGVYDAWGGWLWRKCRVCGECRRARKSCGSAA